MYEKEAIIIFCDIFSSHFQRRSLPQIPSGFPSPIQPQNYPIWQVPIPRNPEELVMIALTSILATGGSIPEGYRMESWFQKGDPPIPPIHSNCNMTTWQAYPVLRTWLASASTVTLVIVFSFHSWTRTSNIVPWVGGGIPSSPNHKIYCDDDRRGAWWYHRYDIRMLFWSRSVHHVFQQQLHCQRYEYHYLVFMHHYHFYLTTMLCYHHSYYYHSYQHHLWYYLCSGCCAANAICYNSR